MGRKRWSADVSYVLKFPFALADGCPEGQSEGAATKLTSGRALPGTGGLLRVLVGALVAAAVFSVVPAASAGGKDRKPPVVSVATPSTGETASGPLTVTGNASDNVKVRKVEISIDGGAYQPASGTGSWAASIDTSTYGDGSHTVTARATDSAGRRSKVSVPVTFENGSGDPQSPPPGPSSATTAEGTKIEIDSAGNWTTDQIAQMLHENGLDTTVGPRITVKVQDTYASTCAASASSSGGTFTSFAATIYLKGVNSSFSLQPDATLAHEYGHAWSLYHLYMSQNGDWTSYLEARGLAGNPNLDSSYAWDRNEIIAEDFRLLFGSEDAISQRPTHLNRDIPDPRDVPGLKTFLSDVWAA